MEEFIESIYVSELLVQCEYAVDAIERMNEILSVRCSLTEFFMIAPRAAIGGNAIKNRDIFRMFDPDPKLVVFRGERVDIEALVTSLAEVQTKAIERMTQLDANRRSRATRMNPAHI